MSLFDLSTLKTVATGLRFPEGPIALDDGSVLVVEIEGGSVARISPDGSVTRYDCGGGPNGQALGPDGAVYVGNDGGLAFKTENGILFPYGLAETYAGGSIQRLDLDTGKVETIFREAGGERIGGLNDVVFDTTGCCYAVDTMRGALHYADPLKRTIAVVEEGLLTPNGMGLSPDGSKLYVSETFSGVLFRWDVVGPGELRNKTQFYTTGGAHGWDGLAVDGAGNVCASNLTESGISVISASGELLGAFKTPEHDPFVTNICFGGPSGDTAYICSSGRGLLYSVKWPWPGLRLNCAR